MTDIARRTCVRSQLPIVILAHSRVWPLEEPALQLGFCSKILEYSVEVLYNVLQSENGWEFQECWLFRIDNSFWYLLQDNVIKLYSSAESLSLDKETRLFSDR